MLRFLSLYRNRVIQRMKLNIAKGNSFAFICEDINDLEHSAQLNLPRVSVIMPLKGFGEHNLQNWRTQVGVERMHKDSKYVLFLDDDIRLHPGSIGALTAEMEKNPEVLNLLQMAHHCFTPIICSSADNAL
ncbi:hypothetical protein BHE74_00026131 [Ensete ventricosum]|nr:hypothetical protein GW17_00036565 [Ensete ventricosum]RWW66488.1 hypothetical protein BHE74_00026131 [Ensete ventricosum]